MTKEIRFNAFLMSALPHMSPGTWTHPEDTSCDFNDLEHWTEFAQLLERGKFDGVFMADILGVDDIYQNSSRAAIRTGRGIPINDPLQLVSAMAAVTKNLGFGITCSISFEHPFTFARRMSTLDHLTKGRVGWNIVTSYLNSGARNIGKTEQLNHDQRYDMADEYMEVCYKLWEGSWEDDAVVADRSTGIYADPDKVHGINHVGEYYTVPGFHLCQPSPQRTPVLYQAGASKRGSRFASRHAECAFVVSWTIPELTRYVAGLRAGAAAQGRDPNDILVFQGVMIVLGETDEAARAKLAEHKKHVSLEATLSTLSGYLGFNLGKFGLDDYIDTIETNSMQAFAETVNRGAGQRFTVRMLAEWYGLGQAIVGTPATVADRLEEIMALSDCDGFNIAYSVFPGSYTDIVDMLVPELQRRGVYKTDYAPGTLREKLSKRAPRLPETHPAANFRNLAGGV